MRRQYECITDANQQGYADAADGEPLFPDAAPEYAAGWWSFHNFSAAAEAFLRAVDPNGQAA